MVLGSATRRWGACVLLVWGTATGSNAQGTTSAPLSDTQFDAQFRCPESLPDTEQQQAVKDYLLWVGKAHPDWTVQKVLETRYRLLQTHQCAVTLQNIRANTNPSTASTLGTSAAATPYPPLEFVGQVFYFHDKRGISSGSALYYAPDRQDPDQASQSIIINYYNAKLDDGSVVSAESIAKAMLQRFSAQGGIVVTSFAVPDKSGNGKLTYFVVSYYIYPSDGNGDIWFSKIEQINGAVVGTLYKRQIPGSDAGNIATNVRGWLQQNLKTYGSSLGGLAAPLAPSASK